MESFISRLNLVPHEFYVEDTEMAAKHLLGKYVVRTLADGSQLIGKIVETEAYMQDEPGSHTYRGQTLRNAAMFGPPGTSYVYLIYGMYYCLNIITSRKGIGNGVLIRALEPIQGLEFMKQRRHVEDYHKLCNGPGKLTMAMEVDLRLNMHDLSKAPLELKMERNPQNISQEDIVTSTRVGLTLGSELPLRFYLKNSEFVSRR